MKQVVLALSGPTGSGKTEWGIRLAKELGGVVIAADSRTVYKTLDIGTNKATYEYPSVERESEFGPVYRIDGIDHYGLNIAEPNEQYTAAMFQQFTYKLLPVLWEQHRVPILVGGTGLYIDAVGEGFQFPRFARLSSEWRSRPTEDLVQELQLWDRKTADAIDVNNRPRVERALAYAFSTGQSFSSAQRKVDPGFAHVVFVIDADRTQLYERLERRMKQWLFDGLLNEIQQLLNNGISHERVREFGFMYRIGLMHIDGVIDEAEMRRVLSKELRHFAKRQLTWWRRRNDVVWVSRYSDLLRLAKRALKQSR